ncbi:hypothetical protein LCGC14_0545360 [marine sediment metagenome]|uniref:Cytochrome b/b6 C-terminal region profile domain-containing protein n=1 Tax=marine sediment metagenome TaxID=412755 RepID=A0A0F9SA10_9ZZZZ
MENLLKIVSKPDNVAIIIMMVMVGFFVFFAFFQALKNDRKKASAKEEKNKLEKEKIHTWPYLARKEFLVAILVVVILLAWSIFVDAPLEEHSNPNLTPNPAKAPWYFLGLQELLVYFDPWIAGAIIPLLIIAGLMLIPYIDINPRGNGYFTFAERKFEILIFCFGFLVLWISLIIIGVFMRGPGWLWFWPWQEWDPSRVVAEINVDLTQLIGVNSRSTPGFLIGGSVIILYFSVGMIMLYLYLRKKKPNLLHKLGLTRYLISSFLLWSMIGIAIKIIMKLTLNIKYIWVTPWFNI